MNCRFFQLNIVCVLLIIVSLSPDDDSQLTSADVNKTSTDSLFSSTRSVRGKVNDNITTSSIKTGGSNVNLTTDVGGVAINNNITSLPTRIPDLIETLTNGTSPFWLANLKSGALERTGLVALGLMSILLAFFVIRAVRVRHKKSKSRKYGIITSTASEMEMEPLEGRGGDDDEEETLFDAHQKYLIK